MKEKLTPQLQQFLALISKQADGSGMFDYQKLRSTNVPEETARIFRSRARFLDSLVSRKLQELRDKNWLLMMHGYYLIVP